jgi:hypothetical protein
MEAILESTLKAICPRVFVTVAPPGTQTPFVVWQQTGGRDTSSWDNLPGKRHARVQISVWASTAPQAASLRSQIESALRPLAAIQCRPSAAHHMTYEPDTKLHGVQQVWEIWS